LRTPWHDVDVNEVAGRAYAAIAAGDWNAVRPLLHPYLHWTDGHGTTLRGRSKVISMLEQAAEAPPMPASVELHDSPGPARPASQASRQQPAPTRGHPMGHRGATAGSSESSTITTPAVAARIRQLAAQAEHHRAIAEFRARHAADQQARVNTFLLEAVAALASLLGAPASPIPPACHHPPATP